MRGLSTLFVKETVHFLSVFDFLPNKTVDFAFFVQYYIYRKFCAATSLFCPNF